MNFPVEKVNQLVIFGLRFELQGMCYQMEKEPDDPDFVDGAKHLTNDMDNTLLDGIANVEKDYQDLLDRMENGGIPATPSPSNW